MAPLTLWDHPNEAIQTVDWKIQMNQIDAVSCFSDPVQGWNLIQTDFRAVGLATQEL